MAAEIAMAESGGNQYALSPTDDFGYWQINASNGSLATYNALGNARSAIILSDDGTNWSPWTTYTAGLYVVHGDQLVPLSDRVIADLALPRALKVASEPLEALICQYPKSSVGLRAYWLPPDSAIAISAAMNACDGLPPACSHSCSRPEQPSVPLSEPDPPCELVWLPCVAAWTVTVPPLEWLPLPLLSLW